MNHQSQLFQQQEQKFLRYSVLVVLGAFLGTQFLHAIVKEQPLSNLPWMMALTSVALVFLLAHYFLSANRWIQNNLLQLNNLIFLLVSMSISFSHGWDLISVVGTLMLGMIVQSANKKMSWVIAYNVITYAAVLVFGYWYQAAWAIQISLLFAFSSLYSGFFLLWKEKVDLENKIITSVQDKEASEKARLENEKNGTLGELAGHVARELQKPIQLITDNVIFMKQTYETASSLPLDLNQPNDLIQNTIGRISKVTKGFLIFARNSDEDIEGEVNGKEVLENMAEMLREKLLNDRLKLNLVLDENLKIQGRQTAAYQLVYNILSFVNFQWNQIRKQNQNTLSEEKIGDIHIKSSLNNDKIQLQLDVPFLSVDLDLEKNLADSHLSNQQTQQNEKHLGLILAEEIAKRNNWGFHPQKTQDGFQIVVELLAFVAPDKNNEVDSAATPKAS